MPIIAQGLQKSYGSRTVVRGVDLELHRGEIVGLLGQWCQQLLFH